jgi:hypothetical protein
MNRVYVRPNAVLIVIVMVYVPVSFTGIARRPRAPPDLN